MLPTELLCETVEYMNYASWLAVYESLEEADAQRMLHVTVPEMFILPEHAGKPVPFAVTSIHASKRRSRYYTQRVVSRLKEVLRKAERVLSISLTGIPVDPELFDLMCRHAALLKRLSIKSGTNGPLSALQPGWISVFKNLGSLELCEFSPPNVDFPDDFKSLAALTRLCFDDLQSLPLSDDAFRYLYNLKYLKLRTRLFPHGALKPLINLRELNIENHPENCFGPRSFRGLANLRKLVLPRYPGHQFCILPGTFSHLGKLTSVKFAPVLLSGTYVPELSLKDELERRGFTLMPGETEFVRSEQAAEQAMLDAQAETSDCLIM